MFFFNYYFVVMPPPRFTKKQNILTDLMKEHVNDFYIFL